MFCAAQLAPTELGTASSLHPTVIVCLDWRLVCSETNTVGEHAIRLSLAQQCFSTDSRDGACGAKKMVSCLFFLLPQIFHWSSVKDVLGTNLVIALSQHDITNSQSGLRGDSLFSCDAHSDNCYALMILESCQIKQAKPKEQNA